MFENDKKVTVKIGTTGKTEIKKKKKRKKIPSREKEEKWRQKKCKEFVEKQRLETNVNQK